MKYVAIIMLGTTLFGLAQEGRFTTTLQAAAQGDISAAAVELVSSMRSALHDHDTEEHKRMRALSSQAF